MSANKTYEKLIKRLGMEVWHGKIYRDVDEVAFKGLKLFSIPSKMNRWPNDIHRYRTLQLPNFHELENKARWYRYVFLNPNWYQTNLKEYANQKFNPHEYEIS